MLTVPGGGHADEGSLIDSRLDLVTHALVAPPVGERRPVEVADEVDVARPGRADGTYPQRHLTVVHGQEAGHSVLDVGLVHHVGGLQPDVGQGP